MNDFTKRYNLEFNKAFIFRGVITQKEYIDILQDMGRIIASNNNKLDGYITTCTHGIIDDNKADMEIIIPIDGHIDLDSDQKEKYQFVNNIEIKNCLKIRHEGNPQLINETLEIMKKYIKDNNLEQISDIYIVTIKDVKTLEEIDDVITEAYVQVK